MARTAHVCRFVYCPTARPPDYPTGGTMRRADRLGLVVLAVAVFGLSWLLGGSQLVLLNFVGLYAIAAIGLSLLAGDGGQVLLGHAAVFRLRAHATGSEEHTLE